MKDEQKNKMTNGFYRQKKNNSKEGAGSKSTHKLIRFGAVKVHRKTKIVMFYLLPVPV